MSEPQNRLGLGMAEKAARSMLLQRAQDMIGQELLAEGLGIEKRSLRAKISFNRGVADDDLLAAAAAIEARAATLAAFAASIRNRLAPAGAEAPTTEVTA